jgi:hypothetical protein
MNLGDVEAWGWKVGGGLKVPPSYGSRVDVRWYSFIWEGCGGAWWGVGLKECHFPVNDTNVCGMLYANSPWAWDGSLIYANYHTRILISASDSGNYSVLCFVHRQGCY